MAGEFITERGTQVGNEERLADEDVRLDSYSQYFNLSMEH